MNISITLSNISSDMLSDILALIDGSETTAAVNHSGVITPKSDTVVADSEDIKMPEVSGAEFEKQVNDMILGREPELAKSSKGDLIPWDERIHSSGKSITKDGRWTMKRKVEPELVDSVESELNGGEPLSATVETLSTAIAENNLSIFAVADALDKLGLQSIHDANGNPELIKQIKSELGL